VDVKDCYELTAHAFNLAEAYRCPVFLATNKEIAMTRETIDLDTLDLPVPVDRRRADPDRPFLPFDDAHGPVPPFLAIGDRRPVRQTSSTHGPNGYITTNPEEIAACQARLEEKLASRAERFTFFDHRPADGAETLVVAYGVTARAAGDAVRRLEREGVPASLLVLKTLWPVPEGLIVEKARGHRRVVVVEMNLGQYVREIRRLLPDREVVFHGQMNGELIPPDRIAEVVRNG
jgi:2-oxoglutarate ferredoxin oxidoreductase subunit alpha